MRQELEGYSTRRTNRPYFSRTSESMKQRSVESERGDGAGDFRMQKGRSAVEGLKAQWALEDVLNTANTRNELTVGVHKVAEELAEDHCGVALCVLVDDPNTEPGVHVHCRLIEAFCWECFIPVAKVDSNQTLKQLLGNKKDMVDGLHCALVKGNSQPSEAMKTILSFTRQALVHKL